MTSTLEAIKAPPVPKTVPQPEPDLSNTLRGKIFTFPYWYHRIELPGGLVTPGWAPLAPQAYRIPDDLTGKRVLDAGAWDGYWTFEALRRGASEVVAIDDFSDHLGSLDTSQRKAWQTFDLCADALGYTSPRCQRYEDTVYGITKEKYGMFDVVFAFGLLYHLRYPMLALDGLSSVCSSDMYVESAILDDFSPYRGGIGNGYSGGQIVAEFYPENEYGHNATNWWVPTLHCLGHMVRSAGFATVNGWKLTDNPRELAHCRGFVHATKLPGV